MDYRVGEGPELSSAASPASAITLLTMLIVFSKAFHLGDEAEVGGDHSAGGGRLALFLGDVALGYGQFHGVFDGQLSLAHIPFGSLQLF
ncbi:MAG: hypothetical protein VCE12_02140 [Candidatus Latescibacterota bacterium]